MGMFFTPLAAFFSQMLASRIMPALIQRALSGADLTEDYVVVHGSAMQLWAFGGFAESAEPLLHIIQSECGLESGDMRYVHVGSFASIAGQRAAWSIYDAKEGELASGKISSQQCLTITRPSLASYVIPLMGETQQTC